MKLLFALALCFVLTFHLTAQENPRFNKIQLGVGGVITSGKNTRIVHPDFQYIPASGVNIDLKFQVDRNMNLGVKQVLGYQQNEFDYPGMGKLKRIVRYYSIGYEHLFNIRFKKSDFQGLAGIIISTSWGTIIHKTNDEKLTPLMLPKQQMNALHTGNIIGLQYQKHNHIIRFLSAFRLFPVIDDKNCQKNIAPFTFNLGYFYEI